MHTYINTNIAEINLAIKQMFVHDLKENPLIQIISIVVIILQ